MLILLPLVLAASAAVRPPPCELREWEEIRELRSRTFADGNFDRTLELAECELRALQAAPGWLRDSGVPVHACEPLEVIFKICNERLPALGCAGATLDRYRIEGCVELPRFTGEYHRLRAQYHQRRMEYAEALVALTAAEQHDSVCWSDDEADEGMCGVDVGVGDDLLELAFVASQRVEIAAALRGWSVVRDGTAAAEDLLARTESRSGGVPDARNLLAWSMLVAREAGGDVGDPSRLLAAALDTFEGLGSSGASNVRINLGLAALQREALGEVDQALAAVNLEDLSPEELQWLRVVQVRAALAAGDVTRVEPWVRELEAIAAAGEAPMGRWIAAWCRGLVHEAGGRLELAVVAYQAAEAELELLAHGPLAREDNRASERAYLNFGDATRRLVRTQLELGDPAAAARMARHARTRALRVAARESCPAAEHVRVAPPAPGELHLLYFPVSPQAPTGRPRPPELWAGFAITSGAVRAELLKLPPIPGDWSTATQDQLVGWSTAMLEPFRKEVERATGLVVLASGPLTTVPVHALPWGGDILLALLPVRHGLDVETCGRELAGLPMSAQILRDPAVDFTLESRGVADALKAGRYAVETSTPRVSADLASLLDEPATVVHIAAHGQQLVGDGLFAADDHLVFADGLTLTRPQILAAGAAPAVVFMSSCRSSFVDAEALGGGLSLAQAFMLRGAHFVVGADGDLDGELATAFATRFHVELAARSLRETPAAWQSAYMRTREEHVRQESGMRMLRLFAR